MKNEPTKEAKLAAEKMCRRLESDDDPITEGEQAWVYGVACAIDAVTAKLPKIHNLKMLDAIHRVVMEHSGNKELADDVWNVLRPDGGRFGVAPPAALAPKQELTEAEKIRRYKVGCKGDAMMGGGA